MHDFCTLFGFSRSIKLDQDPILFFQDELEGHLQDKGIPVDILCCLHHLQVALATSFFSLRLGLALAHISLVWRVMWGTFTVIDI